jgi:hypothetical protein
MPLETAKRWDADEALVRAPKDRRNKTAHNPQAVTAEVWCIIRDIGTIDTANMTVMIKADLFASWFDERLRPYYDETENLIDWDHCWSPRYDIANKTPDLVCDPFKYDVLDENNQQMMCWLSINGTIDNSMDLKKFPFDWDDIEIIMDASNVMKAPEIDELDFVPVRNCLKNRVAEHVLQFGNSFDPVEDMLQFDVFALETQRGIFTMGEVEFAQINYKVKVLRKPLMIAVKVIFPLFMCGILSLSPLQMDPISEYVDRINYIVVMFLAISAFLFVIDGETPSTPYLKTLDYLVSVTTSSALMLGGETMAVRYLRDAGIWDCDPELSRAERDDACSAFDGKFGETISIFFVGSFLFFFVKAVLDFRTLAAGKRFDKRSLHEGSSVRDLISEQPHAPMPQSGMSIMDGSVI